MKKNPGPTEDCLKLLEIINKYIVFAKFLLGSG